METYNRVVDIDQDSRVGRAISTWEGYEWARRSTAPSRDRDLAAGDVELGAALTLRHVQSDVLHAEQIVTAGRAGGDFERDRRRRYCNNLVSLSSWETCKTDEPFDGHSSADAPTVGSSWYTLNHTVPSPSQVPAVLPDGTLAMYASSGPGW